MNELLAAFENAIRRIVQEELAKKNNDFDFIAFVEQNAFAFDKAVAEGLQSSDTLSNLMDDRIERFDFDEKIQESVSNFDFSDKMAEAARCLSFTVVVDE